MRLKPPTPPGTSKTVPQLHLTIDWNLLDLLEDSTSAESTKGDANQSNHLSKSRFYATHIWHFPEIGVPPVIIHL